MITLAFWRYGQAPPSLVPGTTHHDRAASPHHMLRIRHHGRRIANL